MRLLFLLSLAVSIAALAGCGGGGESDKPVHFLALSAEPFTVYHGERALNNESDINALLKQLAAHTDPDTGYPGPGEHHTENVLCLHAVANAPADRLWKLVQWAAKAGFYKFLIGTDELTDGPPEGEKAPDFDAPPAGYHRLELPRNAGRSGPIEQITIYIMWDESTMKANAVVAIDARGRKVVEGTYVASYELVPPQDANAAAQLQARQLRETWVNNVCAAAEQYIANSGANIGRLAIGHAWLSSGQAPPAGPWIYTHLTWQALHKVNANRVKARKPALEIFLPCQDEEQVAAPREQPPERPVDFPKDSPERENPTRDEGVRED
ncbi:MAG: hypothetical protein IPK87_11385 [Planctomycetes bacterium]|nr:hypothetical protein [Planctomycetota bacterium]